MLNSPVVDIAIGLSFLYFLLGLLVSSLNEMIQTWRKTRPRHLHEAIINFLDRDWEEIGQKIMDSPYVRCLQKEPGKKPSYIPSAAFVNGLLEVVKNGEKLPATVEEVREKIEQNPVIKGDARIWLLGMLDSSYGKLENFYLKLEDGYNQAMDRVSGWYGRMAKRMILILGAIIAVGLNIDSIEIVRSLWQDKAAAQAYSALATQAMQGAHKQEGGFEIKDENGKVLYSFQNEPAKNLTGMSQYIGKLPLPFGWDCNTLAHENAGDLFWLLLQKLAGWSLTALAIFLGAPFWFDLLGRIVNLRGAGTKPKSAGQPVPG